MLAPEDDLELLNSEGHTADESKFASFFLGPTYKIVKELLWSVGVIVICLCVSALIFTYTERKWDILNSEIGEGEWDKAYISTQKYKDMKWVYDAVDESLSGNKTNKAVFRFMLDKMCHLKRDVYDFKWHFGGGLDFVISLLTTTGWGVIIPTTMTGKILTVLYFLGGIPFMMAFLFSLVRTIDTTFKCLRKCIREKMKSFESHSDGMAMYLVIVILIGILTAMIVLCAGVSVRREHKWDISGADYVPGWADGGQQNWVFWDAFYYQIISLCTVGFGDFHHKAYDISFGANQFFFVFIPICLFIALLKVLVNQFKESRVVQPPNDIAHQ